MKTSMGWLAVMSSVALVPSMGCVIDVGHDDDDQAEAGGDDDGGEQATLFRVTNLVADREGEADNVDPFLVNPWGVAFGPDTFFWVANNGTSTSTLYDGEGGIHNDLFGGPIRLPGAEFPTLEATAEEEEAPGPTGVVFNASDAFEVEDGVPSAFVFATTAGTILGWSPNAEDPGAAVVLADESAEGAEYTGLAIAPAGETPRLYAADFALFRIDVYDRDLAYATDLPEAAFIDPELPAGYSPFNVQEIDGMLYVAYALRGEEGEETPGAGKGIVSVYDLDGNFVMRLASGGDLNAPWGLVRAPDEFGDYAGAVLVGNFGDGRINAYTDDGDRLGSLMLAGGEPIAIDGLWALVLGNDAMAGESDDLYFTAGPDDEQHGVFGEIALLADDDE